MSLVACLQFNNKERDQTLSSVPSLSFSVQHHLKSWPLVFKRLQETFIRNFSSSLSRKRRKQVHLSSRQLSHYWENTLPDRVPTARGFVPARPGSSSGLGRCGVVPARSTRSPGTAGDANRLLQFSSWPLSSAVCIYPHTCQGWFLIEKSFKLSVWYAPRLLHFVHWFRTSFCFCWPLSSAVCI